MAIRTMIKGPGWEKTETENHRLRDKGFEIMRRGPAKLANLDEFVSNDDT